MQFNRVVFSERKFCASGWSYVVDDLVTISYRPHEVSVTTLESAFVWHA